MVNWDSAILGLDKANPGGSMGVGSTCGTRKFRLITAGYPGGLACVLAAGGLGGLASAAWASDQPAELASKAPDALASMLVQTATTPTLPCPGPSHQLPVRPSLYLPFP